MTMQSVVFVLGKVGSRVITNNVPPAHAAQAIVVSGHMDKPQRALIMAA
jgi:hypothetical protein